MKNHDETRRRIKRLGHNVKSFAAECGLNPRVIWHLLYGEYISDDKVKIIYNKLFQLEIDKAN